MGRFEKFMGILCVFVLNITHVRRDHIENVFVNINLNLLNIYNNAPDEKKNRKRITQNIILN